VRKGSRAGIARGARRDIGMNRARVHLSPGGRLPEGVREMQTQVTGDAKRPRLM
jgi:hypothetical protein